MDKIRSFNFALSLTILLCMDYYFIVYKPYWEHFEPKTLLHFLGYFTFICSVLYPILIIKINNLMNSDSENTES